jgi:hypothetical protein
LLLMRGRNVQLHAMLCVAHHRASCMLHGRKVRTAAARKRALCGLVEWDGAGGAHPSVSFASRSSNARCSEIGRRCGGLRLTGRRFRWQGRASLGAPVRGGLVGGRAQGPPSGTHVGSATGTPEVLYRHVLLSCSACDGPQMGTRRSPLRTSHLTVRTDLPLLLGDGRRLVQLLVPLRARRAVRAHRARRLRDARRERALLRR